MMLRLTLQHRGLLTLGTVGFVLRERRVSSGSDCDGGLSKNFLADAVALASPSVVNIVCEAKGGIFSVASSGSGFMIEDGLVVTNAHVVEKFSKQGTVQITTWEGRTLSGRVFASNRSADIALIKLDESARNLRLPSATLGNSSELNPGEFVAAL
jgi:putative serine protease PepD